MSLIFRHEDGSLKFWQASSENLQIMYKLKTGRHFERVLTNAPTTSTATTTISSDTTSSSSSMPATSTVLTNSTSSVTGGPDSTFPSLTTLTSQASTTIPLNSGNASGSVIAQISHAVINVQLCIDSRLLLVAGASSQVTLFRFTKSECCQDIAVF